MELRRFPRCFHRLFGQYHASYQINNSTSSRANRGTKLSLSSNGTLSIGGQHALFELSILPYQGDHYQAFRSIPGHLGLSKYFDIKSRTARAFLIPNPDTLEIIQRLWTKLTAVDGRFGFIHIRRGDKKSEAQMVPLVRYQERYKTECNKTDAYPGCPRSIFLMCDGKITCDEFKSTMGAGYLLTNYNSLMSSGSYWNVSGGAAEHSQYTFDNLPVTLRRIQTTELIVSLYLAALSDLVVCTYSSNVCRLIALLRGGVIDRNRVHSVDKPNWHGFR